MNIVEIKNLKKYYGHADNEVKAVDNISINIKKGEFLSIVGQSGSGKSTLLHLMGGLDLPTSGEVVINGISIYKLNRNDVAIFRRENIGFIFQAYNLIPVLSVYENIVLPIRLNNDTIDEAYIEDIINTLGLSEKKLNYPNELSGGQQQRVAIARALATRPSIILADEATGNLDDKNSKEVINIFSNISKKFKQTVILITHNMEIAKTTDRFIRILDGKVIE